ncbi:uncharacterized protein LOC125651929 [Ostrea edulis]|uniref:uncharacterized protein LOC125651929 n=1 Tax=Ostrea edulis TaxID=37623 RepID=UPI0024AF1AB6|nr:uncharacterized protein LOC125651929 [Ostrea edulis]
MMTLTMNNIFGMMAVFICLLTESSSVGFDWMTEICRSGLCFNGKSECLHSCNRICGGNKGQGNCNFQGFWTRAYICWCSYDQSGTTTHVSSKTTLLPVLMSSSQRTTVTEAGDCGTTDCFRVRDMCDSACLTRCRPQLYSCGLRWHGRYKCQCIQEVAVQLL